MDCCFSQVCYVSGSTFGLYERRSCYLSSPFVPLVCGPSVSYSLSFSIIYTNILQVTNIRPLKKDSNFLKPRVSGPDLPLKIRPNFSISKKSNRRISAILKERKSKRLPKSTAKKAISSQVTLVPKFSPSQTIGKTLYKCENLYSPSTVVGFKKNESSRGSSSGLNKPRSKNRFVDDSAVEVDCDGNSVASRESTPDLEFHPRPIGQFAIPKIRQPIKPIICNLCFVPCSGPKALEFHQASNKCKNRRDYNLKHKCFDCNRLFETTHDLERHVYSRH